jgi:rsbT co-antagonist protein RsbR
MAVLVSADAVEELSRRDQEILDQWQRALAVKLRSEVSARDLRDELKTMFEALLDGLREGGDPRGESFGALRALLAELSIARALSGATPSETAASVFALKTALEPVLAERFTPDFLRLGEAIDDFGLFTFERYASSREEDISRQAEQLLELSTPVIKLWDGILAVPLVGTLDSARTQVVMEALLQALVETGSAHAIIDITGVAAVDTQVVQHLLKTVVAARLMGAECVISGIRPQIAQTVVALGIEFGDIVTKASLADALRLVLAKAGYEIVRRGNGAR